jgi:hypothetical protein
VDRLHQIADELIRLYRRQLTLWVLGKMDQLSSADLLKYGRRKKRIEQLRLELERMVSGSLERLTKPETGAMLPLLADRL